MANTLVTAEQIETALKRIPENYTDKEDFAALETKVDELTLTGGEPNKIEAITVNDEAQEIIDKTVNIEVPTKVSELENDSDFQNETEVKTLIDEAVADLGSLNMEVVDEVPNPADAEPNVFYLVLNPETEHYDIWVLINGEMVWLDDVTVDLSDYVTKEELEEELEEALAEALGAYYTKDEVDEKLEGMLTTADIISDEDFKEMLDSIFGEEQDEQP